MFDILHRVGIHVPPRDVYAALADRDRLASWWTEDAKGQTEIGGTLHFRFGDRGFFDMTILEADPARCIVWEVIDGPADWIGTRVEWKLAPEGEGTTLRFAHCGWREQGEFMSHCSTKWGTFLWSLKSLLENGKGSPFPDDVLISIDWD